MRAAFRTALAESAAGRLDESAFPAYSHPNPLINWLFWQRLRVVMRFIEGRASVPRALDFGCGGGVMLPFLARHAARVLGLDTDLLPFQLMSDRIAFPATAEVRDVTRSPLESLPAASFGLITALDVLEHVGNLTAVIGGLTRLLAPGGCLIVSGPTENFWYRIGRRLAGPEYSGTYHHRGIGEVRLELHRVLPVATVGRIYPLVTLFEVFAGLGPAGRPSG
jgi:SAM-dependent methyltransferase